MSAFVDHLRAELGTDRDIVRDDDDALQAARVDKSGLPAPGVPVCVVGALTPEQVQIVMRACSLYRVPVVPRGAGTGLAGGATAIDGSVVLDLSGMRRIVRLDPDNELAVVEPGVLNADLSAAAAPFGLRFAPDPASAAIATVGGNIATNAGGLRCVKYGVTREAVLALDVVLADGRRISTGRTTVKGVAGLDLTALLVGSEGTLGVIVGATVRLVPVPRGSVHTVAAAFPDVTAAAAGASAVTSTVERPALLELLDAASLERIGALLGASVMADAMGASWSGDAFLLAQFDGPGAEEAAAAAARALGLAGGEVRLAPDADAGERLVAIRRAFHPAMEQFGSVLIEDVCVPRSRLADMFHAIEAIGARHGIVIPTVAHAGDGNLHPNFVFEGSEVPEEVWLAADEMFRAALELGGTLTGEHGVGTLKARWLRDEIGDDLLALQRGIKELFDPLRILNPGRVFG
ncbi:FAD-binding oxidoreductase [Curtobacterium ammoniigenes]|uniref:FAD-binding oxidoreductase n=1 Tax=Curtobacterium ammoniigenes TaxID=395387 RepID=UPI00082AA02E|nr:FAD-linked oxidase C-terminal domain-containing protein [Curtobacterium ammoniigenes]